MGFNTWTRLTLLRLSGEGLTTVDASSDSRTVAARRLSSRCVMDVVPGISRAAGEVPSAERGAFAIGPRTPDHRPRSLHARYPSRVDAQPVGPTVDGWRIPPRVYWPDPPLTFSLCPQLRRGALIDPVIQGRRRHATALVPRQLPLGDQVVDALTGDAEHHPGYRVRHRLRTRVTGPARSIAGAAPHRVTVLAVPSVVPFDLPPGSRYAEAAGRPCYGV